MLVKNCLELFEERDGADVCDSSTPHRIKMPNIEEEPQNNCKRRVHCKRKKATISAFNPVQQPDKFAKSRRTKCKKSLPQSVIHQKVISDNHKLTEYFPVRRSDRKCKKAVLEQKQRDLENKLLCGIEDGLEIEYFVGKGRGITTTRNFIKGEFVVEYIGELIDQITAKKREAKYAKDQNTGCYMYYFQYRNQQLCVDATAESKNLGRLVNHSRNGNLTPRIIEVCSVPHLVLIAKDDIPAGVEVCYDYGDRSRESIRNHPWLAL